MPSANWELLDRKALAIVRLSLSRNVLFGILNETTTAGLMKVLSDIYEKPSLMTRICLLRRLRDLKMSEDMPVADHIGEFDRIMGQLPSQMRGFGDDFMSTILLASLPDSWKGFINVMSNSPSLRIAEAKRVILSKDICRKGSEESSRSVTSRSIVSWKCGMRGYGEKVCRVMTSSQDSEIEQSEWDSDVL